MSQTKRKSDEVDYLFDEEDEEELVPIEEDHSNVDLDLSSLDTKIWLVKVPKFLAEKWDKIEEDGLDMGKVRIFEAPPTTTGRQKPPKISLLIPNTPTTTDIPREYSIQITNQQVQNMYVFKEDGKAGVADSLAGTVHHECGVVPVYNDEYRRIMRGRLMQAGKPQRSVKVLSDNDKTAMLPAARAMSEFRGNSFKKAKPNPDSKSIRMPRNELMDLLFEGFEKYPYWTLKGIIEYTKQPVSYLKEVLNEICILNKKGPYTSMYQLKPEFKKAGKEKKEADQSGDGKGDEPNIDEELEMDDDDDDLEMVEV
ncbi:hypothetical protein K493DRAFT_317464 [Basidiobolus meristosporus CBS 931.73]|uniref:Transcription initiation factor IIF subunit beta n=1 Tax=Basidiobolus meristosporus CBS 931.73 TaxID=1314790 RepID=A0A1Y1XZK5_9FUNG|nr:hypothetical protein K493DRAFT_317464 [Basidiobolus meristosporus CBS 931.73]|eukprot:ORX91171.1 hypothetical protein K493DRAFT_317464 [Basidiobolus meristosporus CBS 931.73]